jgi:glycosyltransferase involved in cell wall biosynthesis
MSSANHCVTERSRPQGKFSRSVSLLAWAYNEEELIEGFLDKAFALLDATCEDYEIVLVDDASTDRTPEVLSSFASRNPRLRVVRHPRNLNVGRACRTAIAHANKEFLFWQTVDWSYDLSNIRVFLELLSYYDVVQGVRPVPIRLLSYVPVVRSLYRVRTRSDNFRKAIVSLGNYYVLRILFGLKFHDFQNVTFYPTKLLQSCELRGVSSFLNPECLIRTADRGARFIEVPIRFLPREAGDAKGTKLSAILRSLYDIFKNWLAWGWRYRLRTFRDPPAGKIHRVAEPFMLEDEVLALVTRLFREYR